LKLDSIINKILSSKPNLTEEDLKRMIEEKKRAYGGLLSDEGAVRLIAQELLINFNGKAIEVKIKDLVAGLNDVTLTGRVIIDWPIQKFIKNNGEESFVKRFLLADETGVIQCLAWGDKGLTLQKSGELQGKIIKILHGYTREGLKTSIELHLGAKSSITISPANINEEDFPEVSKFINKINEVKSLDRVNLIGAVTSQPKTSIFQYESSTGKVSRFKISDSTGEAALVVWNEQVEKIKDVKIGDFIQIMNGKVVVGVNGSIEVHAEKQAILTVINRSVTSIINETLKIAELKSKVKNVNATVKIINKAEPKLVKVGGKEALVVEALVGDETGLITASFWGENAKLIAEIKENSVLTIINASTKLNGKFTALSIGRFSVVNKLDSNIFSVDPPRTKINEIKNENQLLMVEGVIVNVSPVKEVIVKGETLNVSSLTLKDESGEAEITFWREAASKASSLKKDQKIKVFGVFLKREGEKKELSSIKLAKICEV
jgi:ssDNA-binding replication factor A large subunit